MFAFVLSCIYASRCLPRFRYGCVSFFSPGFSPELQVATDPRFGRTEENFGEDPQVSQFVLNHQKQDHKLIVVSAGFAPGQCLRSGHDWFH